MQVGSDLYQIEYLTSNTPQAEVITIQTPDRYLEHFTSFPTCD